MTFLPILVLASLLQTPPPVKQVSAVLWEYPDALSLEAVFLVKLDDRDVVRLLPADGRIEPAPEAKAGESTYAYPLPAMTVTAHHVTVQACSTVDATVCGPESAVDFRLIVVPIAVSGLRAK